MAYNSRMVRRSETGSHHSITWLLYLVRCSSHPNRRLIGLFQVVVRQFYSLALLVAHAIEHICRGNVSPNIQVPVRAKPTRIMGPTHAYDTT